MKPTLQVCSTLETFVGEIWALKVFLKNGTYFVSSATSTSAGAVMGALECPAVGSSVFTSPLVELIT